MQGQFNSFQKTMLQWNDMHAYNGVHVVRIAGDLDAQRLTSVVNCLLERQGLTNLTFGHKRGTFHYAGGDGRLTINVLAAVPRADLTELNGKLNIAFKTLRSLVLSGSLPTRGKIVPAASFTFMLSQMPSLSCCS
jgi:hypothetical protein